MEEGITLVRVGPGDGGSLWIFGAVPWGGPEGLGGLNPQVGAVRATHARAGVSEPYTWVMRVGHAAACRPGGGQGLRGRGGLGQRAAGSGQRAAGKRGRSAR
ncbi:hypothetical protein GCM10011583_13520 [Streptomyces camponoticapitis]|uniref:Uncharacterized protein n=1 Tax=Streptomyces camponoticapitis TaxID=1616125 RepID=A0ABQ2E0W1_9ACTN|nr:hypothetical protein GCM10011583_13520 [Streptomyces camponoticapitis]